MRDDLTIRAAAADDARFYWDVNNEPSVRAQSIDTKPIPWDVHEAWFAASLERPSRRMFVVEVSGAPAGVVRFDLEGERATISIALERSFRGHGLGSAVIERGCQTLAADDQTTLVEALVRPENVASLRAFERAGFEAVDRVERDGVALVLLKWEKRA